MIKKLVLLLLVAAGATASVPPLRARAAPHVEPVFDDVVGWWMVQLKPVLNPVFRWSAKNQVRRIAIDLKERDASFRPLPNPADFDAYLREHTVSGREGRDPWGSKYYFVLTPDSIIVASFGPDLSRGTADDVRTAVPRR